MARRTSSKSGASPAPRGPDESTLPCTPGRGLDAPRRRAWQVTIAWHPQVERIGAVCHLDVDGDVDGDAGGGPGEYTLGRCAPEFITPEGQSVDLGDPHVSRAAFTLVRGGREGDVAWQLCRRAGASRLRLDGREVTLGGPVTDAQATRGFCLALGERVLLHLRLTELADRAESSDERDAVARSLRGVGPAMQALRATIRAAAGSGDDVLLIGPTGTGKELVARAIHAASSLADAPWVPVNMAAIPVDLAAASLFGARRGAFTGADTHRPGYFQQARGGTLFLDEVGDTPPAVQPLLLRALQEREVQVVGGQPERVDLRVISAMERDPDEADFAFRGALRHRLGRQEIRLPTLAQRAEDIGLLAAAFFERGARDTGLWPPPPEDPRWLRLFELLLLYPWPGNVRELEHAVSQIRAASGAGRLEVPGTLLQRLRGGGEGERYEGDGRAREHTGAALSSEGRRDIAEGAAKGEPAQSPGVALADLDDEALYRAWCAADCEVATLARHYGVSRPSVYRRIKSSRRCRLAADVPLQELLSALEACRGDLVGTAQRLAVSRRGLEARLRAGGVPAMPHGATSADGD